MNFSRGLLGYQKKEVLAYIEELENEIQQLEEQNEIQLIHIQRAEQIRWNLEQELAVQKDVLEELMHNRTKPVRARHVPSKKEEKDEKIHFRVHRYLGPSALRLRCCRSDGV